MRGSATPRPVTALAALLLCAAGCTICPDPFDYSGPVPDGSAPQNDFHARANGILPLGSHPLPWPPVVQAPSRTDAGPPSTVAAGAEPEAAPAADPAAVQPVAAEDPVADATTATPQPDADEPAVTVAPDVPVLEAILPPSPPRAEVVPPLRETPGWKPRG